MANYLDELAALYDAKRLPYFIHNGVFWHLYSRMVEPLGPYQQQIKITDEESKMLLAKLGGILIRWTGFPNFEEIAAGEQWFALTSRSHYELNDMNTKYRSKFKKAFKTNNAQRVDGKFIAEEGYAVYRRAYLRYGANSNNFVDESEFRKNTLVEASFPDLVQFFAVFHNDVLAGYSKCFRYDSLEAHYLVTKYDPDYLKFDISLPLIFAKNEYYLGENRVKCVSSGFKQLDHQTDVHEFYIRNFKFQKSPLPLHIRYGLGANLLLTLGRPVRNLLMQTNPKLNAFFRQDDIFRIGEKESSASITT